MKQPHKLPMLPLTFDSETELLFYKKVVHATAEIEKLKQKLHYSLVNESFIQLMTLQESVQSTRIEGTQVTFSEMLEDKVEQSMNSERVEVRNYQAALEMGVDLVSAGNPITERLIRQLHEMLMKDARGSTAASGSYRKIQNFIGPTKHLKDATYIPPEPQEVNALMANLEREINGHPYINIKDDIHPLIKAGIIHAQFESIHPFLDGNGRLGRILIVLYLLKEEVIDSPLFFLSEELEKEKFKYYAMLNGIRLDPPDWKSWLLFFLQAAEKMASRQYSKLDAAEELYNSGKNELVKDSHKQIWGAMFKRPIANVEQLSEGTGLALSTVRKALRELVDRRMIYEDDRKRYKRFYHYDLISILNDR
ncbi:Fic family protein [Paenalkalicoccus suaedae]|uniref:Fic family protein n=1 Tax=Paenalkalicoccus suaedae TaxID=2592382 RepID=A0A859FJ75_9BACI|nr:Fic family protein [Paenalkalicoccus suaedae]QKS72525.1 Fic family protein [Paenalkalicoccus suaedae]